MIHNTMLSQKNKNIIPYELYSAKRAQQPDHLSSLIKRKHRQEFL